VVLGQVLFVVLHAGVNLNLARFHVGEFPVLLDMGRSAGVARLLMGEEISSDTVVRVVAASRDVLSSVPNAADGVSANFNIAGCSQTRNHSFK